MTGRTNAATPQHRGSSDPDRVVSRRAARRVGILVAALSAGMFLAGVLLLFTYLWFDAWESGEGTGFDDVLSVELDADDILGVALIVGMAMVVLAGAGAMLFARQAVRPLEESMRRQRTFIGDASHELRTPLAVLDARIQQLQIMASDDASLQPVIAELREDSRIMTDIVSDLLASASDPGSEFEPAGVGTVISQVEREMRVVADARGVGLRTSGAAVSGRGELVALPEVALHRSLAALVDNAIAHTDPGGSVTIDALAEGRWTTVLVIDDGRGITGIPPDRVFERFAHGTPPQTGGATRSSHGIGLALVHDVVTRHGGTIEVERTGPSGTVFRLRLPTARRSA